MKNIMINESIYGDYGKCIEISNKIVDLVVTLDVGPRIMRYGFFGKKNVLLGNSNLRITIKGQEWKLYGGHRLWCSPEAFPRNYWPDNIPVLWEKIDNGIRVYNDELTWVQVEMK